MYWTTKGQNLIQQTGFQVFRGTVTDAPDFNPSADAEALYNAMKGFGKCPPAMNSDESASQLKPDRFIV